MLTGQSIVAGMVTSPRQLERLGKIQGESNVQVLEASKAHHPPVGTHPAPLLLILQVSTRLAWQHQIKGEGPVVYYP